MRRWLHSRIALSTASGIESFSAHEKSTIKMDTVFCTLRVSRPVSTVPKKLMGTSLSARWAALPSREDFRRSDSSIMATIFS